MVDVLVIQPLTLTQNRFLSETQTFKDRFAFVIFFRRSVFQFDSDFSQQIHILIIFAPLY